MLRAEGQLTQSPSSPLVWGGVIKATGIPRFLCRCDYTGESPASTTVTWEEYSSDLWETCQAHRLTLICEKYGENGQFFS